MLSLRSIKYGVLKEHKKITESDQIINYIVQDIINQTVLGRQDLVVLKAATGIGKSTEFIYQLWKQNPEYHVICSQVTKLNCKSIADYMQSSKEDLEYGKTLGIKTGDTSMTIHVNYQHSIIYQTVGSVFFQLLMPFFGNKDYNLGKYIIVIDEAHQNSMEQQIALAAVQYIARTATYPPLFIIQSASIDLDRFQKYYDSKINYQIIGASNPIQQLYLDDMFSQNEVSKSKISQIVCKIIKMIINQEKSQFKDNTGSILVFCAKQRVITAISQLLKSFQIKLPIVELSANSLKGEDKADDQIKTKQMKIILSTNVAETGITIPHLGYVVDTMKFNSVSYNPVQKTMVERVLPICKSMQQQRMGRVGRIKNSKGVYIGCAQKSDVQYLMTCREPQIQITQLFELISKISYKYFKQLQFIVQIPVELILDYQQLTYYLQIVPNDVVRLQRIFILDMIVIENILLRYFLLQCYMHKFALNQIIFIIAFLQSVPSGFKKQSLKLKRNDFVKIVKLMYTVQENDNNIDFQSISRLFVSICQSITSQQMSIYIGESIFDNMQKFNMILTQSFKMNVMTFHSIAGNEVKYLTKYGTPLTLFLKNATVDKVPKYMVSPRLIDTKKPTAFYLFDCSSILQNRDGEINTVVIK